MIIYSISIALLICFLCYKYYEKRYKIVSKGTYDPSVFLWDNTVKISFSFADEDICDRVCYSDDGTPEIYEIYANVFEGFYKKTGMFIHFFGDFAVLEKKEIELLLDMIKQKEKIIYKTFGKKSIKSFSICPRDGSLWKLLRKRHQEEYEINSVKKRTNTLKDLLEEAIKKDKKVVFAPI